MNPKRTIAQIKRELYLVFKEQQRFEQMYPETMHDDRPGAQSRHQIEKGYQDKIVALMKEMLYQMDDENIELEDEAKRLLVDKRLADKLKKTPYDRIEDLPGFDMPGFPSPPKPKK